MSIGNIGYLYFFKLIMKNILLPLLLITLLSCKSKFSIVDRPINFDDERKDLTLQYLSDRYGLEQDVPKINPKMIVLHWTDIPTLEQSFKAFEGSTLPNSREGISSAGALNVSSQFLIDRDGTIYRLMPEDVMARHVIGLNHTAIGVENIGSEKMPLTKAQLRANEFLIRYLKNKYPIEYLIGHYEYTDFVDHPLWLEKDDSYRTVKVDPGEDFMEAIRKRTKDLNFKKNPTKK